MNLIRSDMGLLLRIGSDSMSSPPGSATLIESSVAFLDQYLGIYMHPDAFFRQKFEYIAERKLDPASSRMEIFV